MKPLQNQYQDLLEGKMSKFNFLNNIKRNLPNLVSNVTSFDDAVKILKSKRILSEVEVAKEVFSPADENALEKIVSKYVKDSDDIEKEIESYHSKGYQGFSDMLKANLSRDDDFQTWVEYTKDQEQYKREMSEAISPEAHDRMDGIVNKKHIHNILSSAEGVVRDLRADGFDDEDIFDYIVDIIKRGKEQEDIHALPGAKEFYEESKLNEDVDITANLVADIDKVNPLEYRTGIDYELDLSGDFSAEGLEKAVKKVLKNLAKDQIYYTNLKAELTSKINKKQVEAAKQVEVKKDNQVDKLNQVKTLVKKELANTKVTLGKKEKVTKVHPQGVKLMKENQEQELEKAIKSGKIKPEEVKAAAEKAMKGDSTDLAVLMAFGGGVGIPVHEEEKFDPKQHQKDDLKKFSDKMIKQVQGGPATKKNTLKDKIKEYITKQLKKEAVKFTIGQTGQEHEYKNEKDAVEFEKDLRNAKVPFTKSKV